ncbi:uncharacterized protein [Triticum aestivum]|uniref:uncharacterized protein isoform X2 n=1 Tax=Triticum aestivum TaxID=4565 RepID=UPI001D00AA92|nr:uncharacterized protein LOC123180990 isoform X2 [Triticum aestivum]
MAFLGGSLNVTRSIDSRKRMDGRKSGGGSWQQAPAPVRQLFWWVRRAMLWPKRRAVSFGGCLLVAQMTFLSGAGTVEDDDHGTRRGRLSVAQMIILWCEDGGHRTRGAIGNTSDAGVPMVWWILQYDSCRCELVVVSSAQT